MSRVLLMAAVLCFAPACVQASVVFYITRSAFDALNPGLPVEGFNASKLVPNQVQTLAAPLSSSTNNSIFSTNGILKGLSITTLDTTLHQQLVAIGDSVVSGENKSVGTNESGDTLVLSFGSGVTAVEADVYSFNSPAITSAGTFQINVYNGKTLLGSTTVSEALGTTGYFGVTSTTAITSIQILFSKSAQSTYVDNIAFGKATAVPEPGTWALVAGAVAIGYVRRRRST